MNYSDITIGIVSFKSSKVIFNCLKSIKKISKIIIIDNSKDIFLKKKIKKYFPKVKFFFSKKNNGYGDGNNQILKKVKTPYVFILSPDTILHRNCETELLKTIRIKKFDFSIIAPLSHEKNYGFFKKKLKLKKTNLLEVDYVKGFAMLFNLKKIKKIGMFDEKIFLYLEEIDLCRRLRENNDKIYINQKSLIKHIGASSSNIGFEYDKCRNWHWMWSKAYYEKKYENIFYIYPKYLFILMILGLKIFFYLIKFNKKKTIVSYMRFSGLLNSLLGNKSWYRPNLNQ